MFLICLAVFLSYYISVFLSLCHFVFLLQVNFQFILVHWNSTKSPFHSLLVFLSFFLLFFCHCVFLSQFVLVHISLFQCHLRLVQFIRRLLYEQVWMVFKAKSSQSTFVANTQELLCLCVWRAVILHPTVRYLILESLVGITEWFQCLLNCQD